MSKHLFARLSVLLTILCATSAHAQSAADNSGPYNVTILEGGEGLTRKLTEQTASLGANQPWTVTGWVKPQRRQDKAVVLLAVGSAPEAARALMLVNGKFAVRGGKFTGAHDGRVLRR